MKSLDSKGSTSDICIVNNISFYWRRWFISWLTVDYSLTIFYKFSNWFKISLEVNLLASFFPAWIIRCLGFFLIIGMRLCCIPSTFAPGKFPTFTAWFFLHNLSSIIPFIIESSTITIAFLGYKSWLLFILSSFK